MKTIYVLTDPEHEAWYAKHIQISEWARMIIRKIAFDEQGCTEIWDKNGVTVDTELIQGY